MLSRNFSLYRPSERKHFHLSIHFVAFAVLGASLLVLGITFFSHATLQSHPITKSKNVVSPHAIAAEENAFILEDIWPDDLENPEFLKSLHSCSSNDCIPDEKLQSSAPLKIGLLFPPGSFGLVFLDLVKSVSHSHMVISDTFQETLWIPTSHLPTLTASKEKIVNQQYTHIIRFANLPLLLAVGDALRYVATGKESMQITWLDVQETSRLLIRWHCQLSNLADEKSLRILTLTMEQIAEDPIEAERSLRQFLPVLHDFDENGDAESHFDEEEIGVDGLNERIVKVLMGIDKKLQYDWGHDLETGVSQIIKEMMDKNGEKCPPPDVVNSPSWFGLPTSPLALRVHQLLQTGETYKDDQENCQQQQEDSSTHMSESLFCKTLTPPFDAKSLIDNSKSFEY